MKIASTNILGNHAAYPKILARYNEMVGEEGKVNNKKFWTEVIRPEIPEYSLISWYKFLERFKTETGIVLPEKFNPTLPPLDPGDTVVRTMMTNQQATSKLIEAALNISAERAKKILENPELLSNKEALEIGLKAMKAQDSRIHAVGKLREDNREQEKFDRAFSDASY